MCGARLRVAASRSDTSRARRAGEAGEEGEVVGEGHRVERVPGPGGGGKGKNIRMYRGGFVTQRATNMVNQLQSIGRSGVVIY